MHPSPPPSAPFPTTYADDFNGYAEDAMARFWADSYGSWAVRGGALTQCVLPLLLPPPVLWWPFCVE